MLYCAGKELAQTSKSLSGQHALPCFTLLYSSVLYCAGKELAQTSKPLSGQHGALAFLGKASPFAQQVVKHVSR